MNDRVMRPLSQGGIELNQRLLVVASFEFRQTLIERLYSGIQSRSRLGPVDIGIVDTLRRLDVVVDDDRLCIVEDRGISRGDPDEIRVEIWPISPSPPRG